MKLPIHYLLYILYWLPSMHICSAIMDIGLGPMPKARGAAAPGLGPGPAAPWALVLGPGPISIMAEHMCFKGNQ